MSPIAGHSIGARPLLAERLFAIKARLRFMSDAEIEEGGFGHFFLDQVEIVGPVVLLSHNRFDVRNAIFVGVGPMGRDGSHKLGLLKGGSFREDVDDFRVLSGTMTAASNSLTPCR